MIAREKVTEIYNLYSRELFIYILSFVKSHETAEDILHDCFVRMINYSQKNPVDEKSIRPFLYKISKNLCIDMLKKGKKQAVAPLDEQREPDLTENIEKDLELNEIMARVNELVEKRDAVSRSIFYMRTELDKPYKEIAEDLNISERTAKRKMSQMLEYLANSLKKEDFFLFLIILLALMLFKFVV